MKRRVLLLQDTLYTDKLKKLRLFSLFLFQWNPSSPSLSLHSSSSRTAFNCAAPIVHSFILPPSFCSRNGMCPAFHTLDLSPYFKTFMEPRNRFQGNYSASQCSLAGQYDNPTPTRFLAPIDLKKNSSTIREKLNRINSYVVFPRSAPWI